MTGISTLAIQCKKFSDPSSSPYWLNKLDDDQLEAGSGWTNFYYSQDKAVCGARTVFGEDSSGDVAGVSALEVKFCHFVTNEFTFPNV